MNGHKYVKRTGTPGHYRYWYYDPTSRRQVAIEDSKEHEKAKVSHLRRLIAGRAHGLHSMTDAEMARHVGVSSKVLHSNMSNMTKMGKKRVGDERAATMNRLELAGHGHDFHPTELHEAKHSVTTHEETVGSPYDLASRDLLSTHESGAMAAHEAETNRRNSERRINARRSTISSRRADASAPTPPTTPRRRARSAPTPPTSAPATPAADESTRPEETVSAASESVERIRRLRRELAADGIDLDAFEREMNPPAAPAPEETPEAAAESVQRVRGQAPRNPFRGSGYLKTGEGKWTKHVTGGQVLIEDAGDGFYKVSGSSQYKEIEPLEGKFDAEVAKLKANSLGRYIERIHENRAAAELHGSRDADGVPTESHPAHPSSEAAHELHATDPAFEAAEEPIRRAIASQSAGGNPYLERAVDIFDRIKDHLKEERKNNAGHVLSAISNLRSRGSSFTMDQLKAEYQTVSGRRNFAAAKDDFEKATFHSVDEVVENKPINIEVERMKRGFGAKQFARLQPFLSDAFKTAHPGAPPPYPTYNDLRTWSDHKAKTGEARPEWAGGARRGGQQRAMPKEFFDTMHVENGKPLMPPGWLPLHLAPVWIYMCKQMSGQTISGQYGPAPAVYAGTNPGRQGVIKQDSSGNQSVDLPPQWQQGENAFESALRKYVQMRGNQLVDIPSMKLSDVGLTHADIFKGEGDLHKTITTKIIDPVALMPFVKKEIHLMKQVRKSWTLVVSKDEEPLRKSFRASESKLKKSLIEKIKALKHG